MPELPEVEQCRKLMHQHCLGAKIVEVCAREQGNGPRHGLFDDIIICEDIGEEGLVKELMGRTVVAACRKGKQLWMELDKEGTQKHILFHLGMTGNIAIQGVKVATYKKFTVGEEWPPKFTKLQLKLSNGSCLAFSDPRRLGRIRLRASPTTEAPISLLAPDPYTHPIELDTFVAQLSRYNAPIKAVLLDQEKVVSGVGNWIADEVCYQSKVHPSAACSSLSLQQATSVHTALLSIVSLACGYNADYKLFPKDWLFHYRWGKGGNKASKDSHGNHIKFLTVGSRTSAVVEAVMRMGELTSKGAARKPPAPKKSAKKEGTGEEGGSSQSATKKRKSDTSESVVKKQKREKTVVKVEEVDGTSSVKVNRGKGRGKGKESASAEKEEGVKLEQAIEMEVVDIKKEVLESTAVVVKSEIDVMTGGRTRYVRAVSKK